MAEGTINVYSGLIEGGQGYIIFPNGINILWGVSLINNTTDIFFSREFLTEPAVTITRVGGTGVVLQYVYANRFTAYSSESAYVEWIAIGRA